MQTDLHISVTDSLASAVVVLRRLPAKLNAIINPLMKALKVGVKFIHTSSTHAYPPPHSFPQRETDVAMQQRAGNAIAILLHQCVSRTPSPNALIIRNLCSMLIEDLYTMLTSLSVISVFMSHLEQTQSDGDTKKKKLASSSGEVEPPPAKRKKVAPKDTSESTDAIAELKVTPVRILAQL